MKTHQKNLNISPLAFELFPKVAQHYGVSQSDLLEMMLRDEARKVGLGYLIEAYNQKEKTAYAPSTEPGHH